MFSSATCHARSIACLILSTVFLPRSVSLCDLFPLGITLCLSKQTAFSQKQFLYSLSSPCHFSVLSSLCLHLQLFVLSVILAYPVFVHVWITDQASTSRFVSASSSFCLSSPKHSQKVNSSFLDFPLAKYRSLPRHENSSNTVEITFFFPSVKKKALLELEVTGWLEMQIKNLQD